MPSWVTTLQLAKEWGVPPWELHHGRGMLKWVERHNALTRAQARNDKFNAEQAEREARRGH